MRGTKEMIEVMESFEDSLKGEYSGYTGEKVERIHKSGCVVDGYSKNWFYTEHKTNELFKMFMAGYMLGRLVYMHQ